MCFFTQDRRQSKTLVTIDERKIQTSLRLISVSLSNVLYCIYDVSVVSRCTLYLNKILFTLIDERGSNSLETVFSIAICRQLGDKWQSKTLFLTILDLCSSILFTFSIAAYIWCLGQVWCLIVSIPDICLLFLLFSLRNQNIRCGHSKEQSVCSSISRDLKIPHLDLSHFAL